MIVMIVMIVVIVGGTVRPRPPDRYANVHSAKICGSQGEKRSALGFASKTAMQTCIALKSAPRKGLSIVIKCPNVMDYCKVFFGVFSLRFQRLDR